MLLTTFTEKMMFAGTLLDIFLVVGCTAISYLVFRILWKYPERDIVYGYPIIGSLLSMTPKTCLDTVLRLTPLQGPVFDIFILYKRITIITEISDIRELLMKRPVSFRRGGVNDEITRILGLDHGIFRAEGKNWMRQRKIIAPAFSKLNVKNMLESISIEIEKLLDNIRENQQHTVNFINLVTMFTIRVIGRVAFNFHEVNHAYFFSSQFADDMKKMLRYASKRRLSGIPAWLWHLNSTNLKIEKKAIIATQRVQQCGLEVIAHARDMMKVLNEESKQESNPSFNNSSLIYQLLRAQESEKLSNEEVLSNILVMFVAGTDTTSIGICWTLYFLALHPEIQNEVRHEIETVSSSTKTSNNNTSTSISTSKLNELKLCHACFYEALRLCGPVGILAVESNASTPVTLSSGTLIRPSDTVWLAIDSVKRDVKVFENATDYIPSRWLTKDEKQLDEMEKYFLTFGYGPRICPGMHLAQSEGTLAIANIIKSFTVELACEPHEVKRFLTLTASINKLPLIFRPVIK